MRLYDRRAARWTGRYVHEAVTRRRIDRGSCAARSSTTPIATSPIISRPSTATRRWRRGRCTRTAGAPACCSWPAIRRSRSCATTSPRGGIRDGVPGFIISSMNAYYVFLKFAKLRRVADCAEPERPERPRTVDVLPPHRHRPNLARRPEPGAADGQRAALDRPSRGAGRASRRRAAAARRRRARADPDRAAHGNGSVGRLEVLAGHQAAAARRDPRARSARRGDGVARAVDRHRRRRQGRRRRRRWWRRAASTFISRATRSRAGSTARSTASSPRPRRSARCWSPTACRPIGR